MNALRTVHVVIVLCLLAYLARAMPVPAGLVIPQKVGGLGSAWGGAPFWTGIMNSLWRREAIEAAIRQDKL